VSRVLILSFFLVVVFTSTAFLSTYASTSEPILNQPINGVVMKGVFVSMKQNDNVSPLAPDNYIEDSLKMISSAGLNHVRFVFYWEAYEKDPEAFMNEIKSVANAADKYGLKIIYDNHQWHTSSWFEEKATGFPWSLFEGEYSRGGGGNTHDKGSQEFWADWWDRSVKDNDGKDGWTLMAEFLEKIVLTVDNHSSTIGYEILSEPHVDNQGHWSKIGKFNSFITAQLRNITDKTIVYSMNVPIDLNSHINISPKNLAKMAPSDRDNIAFKVSVYAVPEGDGYQEKRFDLFLETSDLTGVPLYIGEWNNVVRTKEDGITKLNPDLSELTKTDARKILDSLKKAEVWGTAFWRWDYQKVDTANFNLVSDKNGKLVPTKYLGILEDAVERVYGPSVDKFTSDTKESNLVNALAKTGKFTKDEAKEFVSKMQNGVDEISSSDNIKSSNDQANNDNQPFNTNTKKPEQYDNLSELVTDIKSHVIDIENIALSAFQDSGAYQGANREIQDCIDLAGKIGEKLGDQEIVHCSEDANYFENELSDTDNSNNIDDTIN
jgi:polyhydroxyalkanoate synthesis regulator phasin